MVRFRGGDTQEYNSTNDGRDHDPSNKQLVRFGGYDNAKCLTDRIT